MTRIVHDGTCQTPLLEHNGNEPCIHVIDEEANEIDDAVAHYKQGAQGNTVADYRADFLARYGSTPRNFTPGTNIEDRRDNRDPAEVGAAFLAERESLHAGAISQRNGHASV